MEAINPFDNLQEFDSDKNIVHENDSSSKSDEDHSDDDDDDDERPFSQQRSDRNIIHENKDDSSSKSDDHDENGSSLSQQQQQQQQHLAELLASQQKIVALQWELKQSRHLQQAAAEEWQEKLDRIQEENMALQESNDTLEDRHESHIQEFQEIKRELFVASRHLSKLQREMQRFQSTLRSQQTSVSANNNQIHQAFDVLTDRQDATISVLKNTIQSLEEILQEYVPSAEEASMNKSQDTLDYFVDLGVQPSTKMKDTNSMIPSKQQQQQLQQQACRRNNQSGKKQSIRGSFLKGFSSRKGFGSSEGQVPDNNNNNNNEPDNVDDLVAEIFKANQLRFAQYLEQRPQQAPDKAVPNKQAAATASMSMSMNNLDHKTNKAPAAFNGHASARFSEFDDSMRQFATVVKSFLPPTKTVRTPTLPPIQQQEQQHQETTTKQQQEQQQEQKISTHNHDMEDSSAPNNNNSSNSKKKKRRKSSITKRLRNLVTRKSQTS